MAQETANTSIGQSQSAVVPSAVGVPAVVVFQEQVEIPLGLRSLDDFRRWAVSEAFPEGGRIDYLAGRIEVDMSPENLFCHGALKTEICTVLQQRVKRESRGRLFIDRTRVTSPSAQLSVEPDIVFVSRESLANRLIEPMPYEHPEEDQFIEFEGTPDMVVEIVSISSVGKDTIRLPKLYWDAGVNEYWLADARKEQLIFQVHRRGASGFEPVATDADGFQRSVVMDCDYRLDRYRDVDGYWNYNLLERPFNK
jgi:Uma2 family endonuclease